MGSESDDLLPEKKLTYLVGSEHTTAVLLIGIALGGLKSLVAATIHETEWVAHACIHLVEWDSSQDLHRSLSLSFETSVHIGSHPAHLVVLAGPVAFSLVRVEHSVLNSVFTDNGYEALDIFG